MFEGKMIYKNIGFIYENFPKSDKSFVFVCVCVCVNMPNLI